MKKNPGKCLLLMSIKKQNLGILLDTKFKVTINKNLIGIKTILLNCVPCVIKTCSCANLPCVLSCSRANVPYVLTYSRANVSCMLMCSCANVPWVLTCQRALHAYVLTSQRALHAYVFTCQRASFKAAIFSFAAIVAEVVHTVGKV